jgi:hypothetical protein
MGTSELPKQAAAGAARGSGLFTPVPSARPRTLQVTWSGSDHPIPTTSSGAARGPFGGASVHGNCWISVGAILRCRLVGDARKICSRWSVKTRHLGRWVRFRQFDRTAWTRCLIYSPGLGS